MDFHADHTFVGNSFEICYQVGYKGLEKESLSSNQYVSPYRGSFEVGQSAVN